MTRNESRVVKPLVAELTKAFLMPFRAGSLVEVLAVLLVTGALSFIPFVGGLVAAGVRAGYLFAVLRAASDGNESLSVTRDDIGSMVSWIGPFFRVIFTFVVAFAPAFAAGYFLGPNPIGAILWFLGVLYLPAALIVSAHGSGFVGVANPVTALRLIARIPGPYAITCAMLFGLLAVAGALFGVLFTVLGPDSVLGAVLAPVAAFLPLVAAARLLGALVWEQREDL